ncbi:TPA: ATP-binding protein [Legionella pneumophila]
MTTFVGRKDELNLLKGLLDKRSASLVVIYGRRRIGKSRLVEEFGKKIKMISIAGLSPRPNITIQEQLDEFSRQMARQLHLPVKYFTDWGDAFSELAQHSMQGKIIVFFDEITWLGSCDPDFLGKLKNAWDTEFKKNDRLVLILCGSVSAWIERNIISNTGFYGRISLKIHLKELPIKECDSFWENQTNTMSAHDKLKILAVTGGVPKYLEELNRSCSAEENIKRLCFSESGLLFNDYDYIFSALLQRESEYYEKIICLLGEGRLEQSELLDRLSAESGGLISSYLDELVAAGFIDRDYTWHIKTGVTSKLSQYRLSDNYLRFYLKYIKPNIQKIRTGQFKNHSLSALPGWAPIMGFQIENLVLNNRHSIKEKIGIYPDEVISDNPFFQKKTTRQKGCQIDYMIQTKFGNLFVCEIKFSRNVIRDDVISEVQEKIKNLSTPRNFSIKPVLIHASEVHDKVIDQDYFCKIIDLSDLFKE